MRNLQKKRFKYFLAIIKNKITLDRVKSNYFRVLHMNGLSVELMPKGEIHNSLKRTRFYAKNCSYIVF